MSATSATTIVTHDVGLRAVTLRAPVDPPALLSELIERPYPALVRHGGRTIVAADPEEVVVGPAAWEALASTPQRPGPWPMAGGWMGLLAYELAGTVERLPAPAPDPGGPPLAVLARYPTVASIDPDGRCTVASTRGQAGAAELARLAERARLPVPEPTSSARVTTSLPGRDYGDAVAVARELIAAGDCYQVNLAQRLTAPWRPGPLELALRLWRASGLTSHRAFLRLPEGTLISASPERLVRTAAGIAVSEPIKGTAAPGDERRLAASGKDRAEHVMIVDLVRNDLGRVARAGGVRVERLMDGLATPYVAHLVSRVHAELRSEATARDVLRALFPGGSVTGCPKVRAMEIIRQLEPVPRGPAFGSVVALGADGSLEASVAIRTAWLTAGEARYWCGGAVVWDSDPEAERAEAWSKATPFLSAIGA